MKKEGEIMSRLMSNIQEINIPTHIQKQIGLEKNWKSKISPKSVEKVVNTANRFKKALKELSKN